MTTKILLVEDHIQTRQSLIFGFKKYKEIEIIGECENGLEALNFVKENQPDLILMDIAMPVLSGIDSTKKIKKIFPDIKIVMHTSHSDKEKVLLAFNSGADGYCMKNTKTEELINIFKTVLSGSMWIDPAIANYIMEVLQSNAYMNQVDSEKNADKEMFNLTAREKEILELIADGLNNKDISDKLFLSVYTVKNHVSSIIQKLSVDDRTQAAIIALKHRII